MGSKQAKPAVEYRDALSWMTSSQVVLLDAMFARFAKDNTKRGKIDKDVFMAQILKKYFPEFGWLVLERMWSIADTNASGFLEYEEFICVMYIFMFAQRHQKMQFIFNMYDLDANGHISRKEMKRMALVMMQAPESQDDDNKMKPFAPLVELFVNTAMQTFDRHNSGSLTFDEWRQYAADDDICGQLIDCMADVTATQQDIERALELKKQQKKTNPRGSVTAVPFNPDRSSV